MNRIWKGYLKHFRHNPVRDGALYLVLIIVLILYSTVVVLQPILVSSCEYPTPSESPFSNPFYNTSPCQRLRYVELLGLTPLESMIGRRTLFAVVMAALIGYERRSPDRPAGIRTMAVTALGACCFTICSIFGFESSAMEWDASRVTAAIPSGVGFLCAGLIWKGFVGQGSDRSHQVTGLTTSASVWLSAAVGASSGGGLYWISFFSTLAIILILRFGPRSSGMDEDGPGHTIKHPYDENRSISATDSDRNALQEITPLLRPEVIQSLDQEQKEKEKRRSHRSVLRTDT